MCRECRGFNSRRKHGELIKPKPTNQYMDKIRMTQNLDDLPMHECIPSHLNTDQVQELGPLEQAKRRYRGK